MHISTSSGVVAAQMQRAASAQAVSEPVAMVQSTDAPLSER
jgi:hypothetical protein